MGVQFLRTVLVDVAQFSQGRAFVEGSVDSLLAQHEIPPKLFDVLDGSLAKQFLEDAVPNLIADSEVLQHWQRP